MHVIGRRTQEPVLELLAQRVTRWTVVVLCIAHQPTTISELCWLSSHGRHGKQACVPCSAAMLPLYWVHKQFGPAHMLVQTRLVLPPALSGCYDIFS